MAENTDPALVVTIFCGFFDLVGITRNYQIIRVKPGFEREELKSRYDVESVCEDPWHAYSGHRTIEIVDQHLDRSMSTSSWLLNAGSGVYEVGASRWNEISLDLFSSPIMCRKYAVCGTVEFLPFAKSVFGAIICVGEVLAYCDPARTIREFARVLDDGGILICDFGSTRSPKYWFNPTFGRAVDLVIDQYNGKPEKTWIYDPNYLYSLLKAAGFSIEVTLGIHSWSAVCRRVGISPNTAVSIERIFSWLTMPATFSDVMTIVARRGVSEK
jgi:SAM-dependent methyltransferase